MGVQTIPWDPKGALHSSAANGGRNYSRFINDEVDKLIDGIRNTLDPEKRKNYYLDLQNILYEEQPIIYFFNQVELVAIHKRFEGTTTGIPPSFFPNHYKLKEEFLTLKN